MDGPAGQGSEASLDGLLVDFSNRHMFSRCRRGNFTLICWRPLRAPAWLSISPVIRAWYPQSGVIWAYSEHSVERN